MCAVGKQHFVACGQAGNVDSAVLWPKDILQNLCFVEAIWFGFLGPHCLGNLLKFILAATRCFNSNAPCCEVPSLCWIAAWSWHLTRHAWLRKLWQTWVQLVLCAFRLQAKITQIFRISCSYSCFSGCFMQCHFAYLKHQLLNCPEHSDWHTQRQR